MSECTICYQDAENLGACPICASSYCEECITAWAIQQVTGKHFRKVEDATISCHKEKCRHAYDINDLRRILSPASFTEIDAALTLKIVRSSEDYMCCPNKECKGYGFFGQECCTESYECAHCSTKWRMPGQRGGGFFEWISGLSEKVYNSNTYSDLYKVLFAQMCPSCKVMIVRSEGCKFMECGKCRY
jgi:hypothetical protein